MSQVETAPNVKETDNVQETIPQDQEENKEPVTEKEQEEKDTKNSHDQSDIDKAVISRTGRARKAQHEAEEKLKQLSAELEETKSKLAGLSEERERENLRGKVAKEFDLPSNLISGDDEDSMREFAQELSDFVKSSRKAAPIQSDRGASAQPATDVKSQLASWWQDNMVGATK
jgi:uncharacterized phage infection (PIP) family protein YhgE